MSESEMWSAYRKLAVIPLSELRQLPWWLQLRIVLSVASFPALAVFIVCLWLPKQA